MHETREDHFDWIRSTPKEDAISRNLGEKVVLRLSYKLRSPDRFTHRISAAHVLHNISIEVMPNASPEPLSLST